MKTVKTLSEFKDIRDHWHRQSHTIGFVPTMGYLHEGHLSLVDQSKRENRKTVVSIFINPAQFGPNEDLEAYPRDVLRDSGLLEEKGVDAVFLPAATELYPAGFSSYVEVERLGDVLCGASRPGHFRGVTTIVLKLFNIVRPHYAYFGRKDAQQAIIIKKMVKDLNMEPVIRTLPIVRDADGLALSSRNTYLSPGEREAALCLPRSLQWAKSQIEAGLRDAAAVKKGIRDEINRQPEITADYVEVSSLDRLESLTTVDTRNTLVAAAVRVGQTRLIDNFILGDL
ncbi:MAG: pantoate--beta-alanine ligase [bacterium]|nr:pantoate--beta-alanine ligase [bacterium]